MTKEEREKAIDVLEHNWTRLVNANYSEEELNTAFNTALKALKQEPCEDAISRKAVLEYIEGSGAELGHSSENELVCQDIKELPPVIPAREHGEWIPVSSGNLPDFEQNVLIQLECERIRYISDNNIMKYDVAKRIDYKHPMFDADYYWTGKTAYNPTDVIAWQLPEPYTEKGAE